MTNGKETKKPRKAVALTYDPEETAPRITAIGRGYVADRIVEHAKEAKVPLHKDEQLIDTLSQLELGSFIPPEVYDIVAEIMTFVDSMDRIKGKLNY